MGVPTTHAEADSKVLAVNDLMTFAGAGTLVIEVDTLIAQVWAVSTA